MLDHLNRLLLAAEDLVKSTDGTLQELGDVVAASGGAERLANVGYLVASVLFILGIKGMTHPRTAVRGNLLGAVGMLIAVVVTLIKSQAPPWVWISGMAVGTVGGLLLAIKVQMTQMPQLVALFNGFGGIASVLVAGAEVIRLSATPETESTAGLFAGLTGLIGAVTFTGSLVAAGKLQELKQFKKPWSFGGQQLANAVIVGIGVLLCVEMTDGTGWEFFPIVLLSLVLGVLLTTPIGGADMPVVIALLNSYSGLAAAAAGFVINNNVLIIAGSLVGASGIILTQIMCKAMNRSLTNVLFAKFEPTADGPSADEVYAGKIKSTSPEEVAMLLDGVSRVVIVPGYGLA
ncbi:MAG: NAD(P)(+) transhydrogenase (Re/Si-specific) subunit beta, partial [Planctomycetales bacterium]|nr:NAD(P)(+) transhydrogenase (Re/Si-specific) subunit beta [Planctomycetales bacterium]